MQKNEYMEEGKPVPEETIMKIVLINNRTDKQYEVHSDNEFGIEVVTRGNKINFFQKHEKRPSVPRGVFIDFSVIHTEWK